MMRGRGTFAGTDGKIGSSSLVSPRLEVFGGMARPSSCGGGRKCCSSIPLKAVHGVGHASSRRMTRCSKQCWSVKMEWRTANRRATWAPRYQTAIPDLRQVVENYKSPKVFGKARRTQRNPVYYYFARFKNLANRCAERQAMAQSFDMFNNPITRPMTEAQSRPVRRALSGSGASYGLEMKAVASL